MHEVYVSEEVLELIREFTPVYAEITGEDPASCKTDEVANAILAIGMGLMVEQFFKTLDAATLERSLHEFYRLHPDLSPGSVPQSAIALAEAHAELARRYPRQFFSYMLENFKRAQWEKARKKAECLFDKPNA